MGLPKERASDHGGLGNSKGEKFFALTISPEKWMLIGWNIVI